MDKKRKVEYVHKLDIGGPAHWAGLLEGDIVWAINGKSIVGKSHEG